MNVLPASESGGAVTFEGQPIALEGKVKGSGGLTQLGIRPEFVSLSNTGLAARVRKVSDVGRHCVVEAMVGDTSVKAVIEDEVPAQGEEVHLAFRKDQTRLYRDGWLSTEAGS